MVHYFKEDLPVNMKEKSAVKKAWVDETSLVAEKPTKNLETQNKADNPFEYLFG